MTFKSALASSEMPNPALLCVYKCQPLPNNDPTRRRTRATRPVKRSEEARTAQLDASKVQRCTHPVSLSPLLAYWADTVAS